MNGIKSATAYNRKINAPSPIWAVKTAFTSVTLDDMNARKLARTDPELFIQHYPPPVIIDEVQYAPELFPYIKIYVDEHREGKGAFRLTGSRKYRLMQGVKESLAGQIAIFDLMGLSYREKTGRPFSGGSFCPAWRNRPMRKSLRCSTSTNASGRAECRNRSWAKTRNATGITLRTCSRPSRATSESA